MNTEHTPGPWHVAYLSNAFEIREANGSLVTHIPAGQHDAEAREIAELIASAPELAQADRLKTAEINTLVPENRALLAENQRLREALQSLFDLMDSGWLVRNTDDDAKPDFAVRQLAPTMALAKAKAALSATERSAK